MPDIITLNKEKIRLGEEKEIQLNVAMLPTHTPIDLPIFVSRAKTDGPVLLFTGGLHGDEINGIEIVRRLIDRGLCKPDKGTVIAMPIVNVYGFIQNVRGVPDGKDINRSFPGIRGGSLARLLAYILMNEVLPHVDYGVDFHSGGASRANYPQVRCTFKQKINLKLAKAFGAPVTLNSPLISKSFRSAADKKGKAVIVYETGESMRLDEQGIEIAIEGCQRLMQHLNMINRDMIHQSSTELYKKSMWVRARNAGIFQPKFELGDHIQKRQVLGYITDPYAKSVSKVVVTRSGRIIGLNNNPIIHKGDAIAHLAYDLKE
jgi:hypothetical protein